MLKGRRGGDIDLHIEITPHRPADTFRPTQRLRPAGEDELGEQKINAVHRVASYVEVEGCCSRGQATSKIAKATNGANPAQASPISKDPVWSITRPNAC